MDLSSGTVANNDMRTVTLLAMTELNLQRLMSTQTARQHRNFPEGSQNDKKFTKSIKLIPLHY